MAKPNVGILLLAGSVVLFILAMSGYSDSIIERASNCNRLYKELTK